MNSHASYHNIIIWVSRYGNGNKIFISTIMNYERCKTEIRFWRACQVHTYRNRNLPSPSNQRMNEVLVTGSLDLWPLGWTADESSLHLSSVPESPSCLHLEPEPWPLLLFQQPNSPLFNYELTLCVDKFLLRSHLGSLPSPFFLLVLLPTNRTEPVDSRLSSLSFSWTRNERKSFLPSLACLPCSYYCHAREYRELGMHGVTVFLRPLVSSAFPPLSLLIGSLPHLANQNADLHAQLEQRRSQGPALRPNIPV
jgi:hypothetical protein